jgi:pimeloyl-ACP methyl ester carboxylesterase
LTPAGLTLAGNELIFRILRLIGITVAAFIALLLLGLLFLWWSNRDISAAELERLYGGDELQYVNIDGVNLAYRTQGQGPPLVLIHSHFYTMRLWQPWVDTLAENFTIIRYDLTSHGLTGPDPSRDYTRARGAQLLNGLLDHLGIVRASVAGSSTGGGLAWYYAAHFPLRVDKLILVNAAGLPGATNKYMEMTLPDWFGYVLYLLPERLFKPFLQAPVVDKSLITDDKVREFHLMYRREGNRMAEFERMLAWERGDITAELATIAAPTLIMWGEENPQLPVAHASQFAEKLTNAPRVELRIYPNIGHVIPLEVPVQSAGDASSFLQEN